MKHQQVKEKILLELWIENISENNVTDVTSIFINIWLVIMKGETKWSGYVHGEILRQLKIQNVFGDGRNVLYCVFTGVYTFW